MRIKDEKCLLCGSVGSLEVVESGTAICVSCRAKYELDENKRIRITKEMEVPSVKVLGEREAVRYGW